MMADIFPIAMLGLAVGIFVLDAVDVTLYVLTGSSE